MKPLMIADIVRDKDTNLLFQIVGYLTGSETYKANIYYKTPKRGLVRSRRVLIPLKVAEAKKEAGAYDFWPEIQPEIVAKLRGGFPTLYVNAQ